MTKWQENKNARIGIMGGAFNPFHNGHLRHAIEVHNRMSLEHIEILPSAHHPHKVGLLPFEFRLEYVEAAIKNIPFLSINTMENEIPAPSYTEKILKIWREKNPMHKPYFLLGTEDFSMLDIWHNGFELPALANLIIVSRHGGDAGLACKYAQKYWGEIYISYEKIDHSLDNDLQMTKHYQKFSHENQIGNVEQLEIAIPGKGFCTYLRIPHIDISATQIRNLWGQRQCLNGLIPESVQELLEQHRAMLKRYW